MNAGETKYGKDVHCKELKNKQNHSRQRMANVMKNNVAPCSRITTLQ